MFSALQSKLVGFYQARAISNIDYEKLVQNIFASQTHCLEFLSLEIQIVVVFIGFREL